MPEPGDRLPHHSIEAEQGVLGCCLLDPKEALGAAMEGIGGREVFFDLRHQGLFEVLAGMVNAGKLIDPIALQAELGDRPLLEQLGGWPYVMGLMNMVPSAENLPHYLGMVLEKWRLRQMARALAESMAALWSDEMEARPVDEVLNGIEQRVLGVGDDGGVSRGIKTAQEVMQRTVDVVEGCFRRGRGVIDGVSTGLGYLDKTLGGLHNGEMVVIGARPSAGKTALMMTIAKHVALAQKRKVGVFSVEMRDTALMMRVWCDEAGVNMQQVRTGFASERDLVKLQGVVGRLGSMGMFFDDDGDLDLATFRARARRMKRLGCEVIFVDYLQLMKNPEATGEARHLEVASVSRGIKAATKELNIPFVVLAQLNRESVKDGHRKPTIADLGESGQIERDADVIGLLYRVKTKRGAEDAGEYDADGNEVGVATIPVNLMIAKQRNGPTQDVELLFNRELMRFVDRYDGAGKEAGEARAREKVSGREGGGGEPPKGGTTYGKKGALSEEAIQEALDWGRRAEGDGAGPDGGGV